LGEVVRDINKFSNNVMAEQLFLTLAAQQRGQATPAIAKEVIDVWWRERVGGEAPLLDKGSGLSRDGRISAQALARLLQWAWLQPFMPELVASLPLTGVDGTMKRSKSSANAHLKTGSLRDAMGIHSARRGYSKDGAYGEKDRESGRSMAIKYNDSALKTQLQPIARVHPETGRIALYVSPGYTLGIEGWPQDESDEMMMYLFQHQASPEFVYSHRWSTDMLLMWDNRCLIHAATGGYEGHRRLLHRITIAERR
jgi:hypothetical protein